MHELPLVFFTTLAQLGAGAVAISAFYGLFSNQEIKIRQIQRTQITALVFMLVAMALAFLHLGQPLRAFNVIFGLGRSAVSNEIMLFSLFFGLTLLSVILAYLNRTTRWDNAFFKTLLHRPWITKALHVLLILAAACTVWAIILVYQLPTVATWDSDYTALQMITTTLILGGALAALFKLKWLSFATLILGIFTVLMTKLSYVEWLQSINPTLTAEQTYLWVIQIGLLLIALLLIMLMLLKRWNNFSMHLLLLIVVCIAEIAGRIAFYNLWWVPMASPM